MNDMRKLMEAVETLDEAPTLDVGNSEVEQHISEAAKALAKEAVQQAAGVWEDEGDGEGKFYTGAKSGKEYVSIAAPRFLDDEYKGAIMAEFEREFHNYVEYFLEYVDAGAEPDWENAD
jgi:hypothetical protein